MIQIIDALNQTKNIYQYLIFNIRKYLKIYSSLLFVYSEMAKYCITGHLSGKQLLV